MKQNIYDNQAFFDGYTKLRNNVDSANTLEEKPSLFSMLPTLANKSILDLGCGYGENCMVFSEMRAARVVGIDISTKMLEVAKLEHNGKNIMYLNMGMEDISIVTGKFDVVVSCYIVKPNATVRAERAGKVYSN